MSASVNSNAVHRWDSTTGASLGAVEGIPPGSLDPGGRLLADFLVGSSEPCAQQHAITLWDAVEGRPLLTTLFLADDERVRFSPGGHHRYDKDPTHDDRGAERLIYVVQTDKGQETLTAEAFTDRYGWPNSQRRCRPRSTTWRNASAPNLGNVPAPSRTTNHSG